MASGIKANDKCIEEYEKFKLLKNHQPFMLFRINKEEQIYIEDSLHNKGNEWEDFVQALTSNMRDGCYGVYKSNKLNKLCFVSWIPDFGISVKKKMLYGSTCERFKQQLGAFNWTIQANDLSDLDKNQISPDL